MTVELEKNVAEDLITFKLQRTQSLISEILDRWNETSSEIFLRKAHDGTYPNSENDTIDLRQLLLEEKNLLSLLKRIS